MRHMPILGIFLVSLLFITGCQSITGKAIEEFEEKSMPITGKTVDSITTFSIDNINIEKGKLNNIEVTFQTGTIPVNPQFKVHILKDSSEIASKTLDFKEIKEQKNLVLPMDLNMKTGRYELQIELFAANEKISEQNQIFRINIWDRIW